MTPYQIHFRKWMAISTVGNSLVLLFIGLWFPAVGFDFFNFQHVTS
jgi:hypothetical protein